MNEYSIDTVVCFCVSFPPRIEGNATFALFIPTENRIILMAFLYSGSSHIFVFHILFRLLNTEILTMLWLLT